MLASSIHNAKKIWWIYQIIKKLLVKHSCLLFFSPHMQMLFTSSTLFFLLSFVWNIQNYFYLFLLLLITVDFFSDSAFDTNLYQTAKLLFYLFLIRQQIK